jgi:hypothetical protein
MKFKGKRAVQAPSPWQQNREGSKALLVHRMEPDFSVVVKVAS